MNKQGFSLIETIIYVAIIGGVMAAFVSFALNISDSNSKTFVVQEVQANARLTMKTIAQNIRSANGVNLNNSVFATDPGVLSLSMASNTLNPLVISLSGDDGSLQIKAGENATTTITSVGIRVTNLIFNNFSASSTRENIAIDLTVEYASSTDNSVTYSQNFKSAVSLRE